MAASESAQSFPAIFLTSNLSRSSHQRCSIEKVVLENFAIFTGKHLLESLFNKLALQHRCFPVDVAKFLRTSILKNICERLLLFISGLLQLSQLSQRHTFLKIHSLTEKAFWLKFLSIILLKNATT